MFSLFRVVSSKDRGVYLKCSLVGYVLLMALKPAIWAPYAGMLVTYHLFLFSMMYLSEKKSSRSYSLLLTIGGHLGFLAVLVAVRLGLTYAVLSFVESLPKALVGVGVRYGARTVKLLIFLATYGAVELERRWLFSGEKKSQPKDMTDWEPTMVEMYTKLQPDGGPLVAATGADHLEWTQYCARRNSKFYDPRKSPSDDFEQWLRARGKTQYASAGINTSASAS